AFAHGQCGAQGTLTIIVVGQRRSENSQDRIADKLLYKALVLMDHRRQLFEEVDLQLTNHLDVMALTDRRKIGQIGKEYRDLLAVTANEHRGVPRGGWASRPVLRQFGVQRTTLR